MQNNEEIKKEIESIRELLERYNREYYLEDAPSVSDSEYDEQLKKLRLLEEKYPELVTGDSPTKKVGGGVSNKFTKYKHKHKLLSLANAFNAGDLRDFDNRIRKDLGLGEDEEVLYSGELKIDGLTISLIYEKGQLLRGVTRGDGVTGEDVTFNIVEIKDIPKKLNKEIDIEVRGEVYIDNETFLKLNHEREELGEDTFRNPRNCASGTIRSLDVEVTKKRGLKSFIYDIMDISDEVRAEYDIKTQEASLEFLRELGFHVNKEGAMVDIEGIIEYSSKVIEKRHDYGYAIDGFVVKLNNLSNRDTLGVRAKSPRWAIALKFPPEQKETILENITFSMGRTGVITPVAKLKAVLLDGSLVKRATLHNFQYIKDKDIRVGDTVLIEKAGDIIPEVVRVNIDKRSEQTKEVSKPKECPYCGSELIKDGDIFIKCINVDGCSAQREKRVTHFVSKNAMNIDGLGEKRVQLFLELGLIKRAVDIYKLKYDDLKDVEGMKDKSINNLLNSIEASKEVYLSDFLFALGVPLLGKEGAKLLIGEFKTLDELYNAEIEDIANVDGLGAKIAKEVYEFFHNEVNRNIISEFLELGVSFKKEEMETLEIENKLNGQIFVLTGKLDNYTRDEFKKIIIKNGGKVSGSVSKKTNYVVAGDDKGKVSSKKEKALELGIKIIDEQEFSELI